ncbi:MAG: ClpXP protease specificity-enhancing factor [Burkholderiales bacterium]|jgi:stringent starvation protein B|nr:ClpXP protease specificity-enhancing factor [Burkholderiales bacterium]
MLEEQQLAHALCKWSVDENLTPYLVRALCEWCADKELTPYLAVKVTDETRVPMAYVNNGEIVFNLSARTTHQLTINNDWIMFAARFGGVSQEVAVPFSAVTAIFAKETGHGLFFSARPSDASAEKKDAPPEKKDSSSRSSHLRLVR